MCTKVAWPDSFHFIFLWPWIYKIAQIFQAGTHRIWIQHKKFIRNIKKTLYMSQNKVIRSSLARTISGLFLLHLFCCAHFHSFMHSFFWLCFFHLLVLTFLCISLIYVFYVLFFIKKIGANFFRSLLAFSLSMHRIICLVPFFIRRAVLHSVRHASDIWCRYCKLRYVLV